MGEGNKKLSKRDPQAHLMAYRDQGFLPEGLLNYLALLGWAIAADRDIFTLDEMVAAFDIKDVNPNPARFDLKKAEAINAAHMRLLPLEEITERVVPFLQQAGLVADPVTGRAARGARPPRCRWSRERINKLTEAVDMLGFLLVDEAVVHPRRDRRREGADRGRQARRPGVVRRPRGARRLVDREHPGGAPGHAGRGAGPQAAQRLRAGAGGRHRAAGCRRRCSSRWSCSAASAGSAGSRARWADVAEPQAPPPAGALPYHLIQRGGRPGWWRPVVGITSLVAAMLVIVPIAWQLPFAVGLALAGRDVGDGMGELLDLGDPTPLGLAYLNLVLASAIPVTWLITRVVHGLRPRWLASVLPATALAVARRLLRPGVRGAGRHDRGLVGRSPPRATGPT